MTKNEVQEIINRIGKYKFKVGASFIHSSEIACGKIVHIVEVMPFLRCFYYYNQKSDTVEYIECAPSDMKIVYSNVSIKDVLYYMQNISHEHTDDDTFGMYCKKLCLLWEPLNFTHSLQEIIEESEWEVAEVVKVKNGYWECRFVGKPISQHSMREGAERYAKAIQPILKSPEVIALFNFL